MDRLQDHAGIGFGSKIGSVNVTWEDATAPQAMVKGVGSSSVKKLRLMLTQKNNGWNRIVISALFLPF